MEKISFVIPVYNSEKTIEEVVIRIEKFLLKIKKYKFEIILVNDDSKDNSLEVCKRICNKKQFVKLINLSKNFGQLKAVMAGYNYVSGDYIVCLDDDLQINPEDTIILLNELHKFNYDVAIGEYKIKKQSLFRRFGSFINESMANYLINKPKNIKMSSFVLAKRFVIDEIIKYDHTYPYIAGLLFRTTRNIGSVLISHNNRQKGTSNYTIKKLLSIWLNGFTSFSIKPLRLSGIIGSSISFMSFILIIILLLKKIISPEIQLGWTSLIAVITFFGGIQLISIGLVGEYIGRIFMCINKTPQFIIKETYNFKK